MVHDSLSRLAEHLGNKPIDLFICSASFEDRCACVVNNLGEISPRRSLVAMNMRLRSRLLRHSNHLLGSLGRSANVLPLDSDSPIASADSIACAVGGELARHPRRIVIDTTTFTREALLILLRYLDYEATDCESIEFLYAHAKEYSIGDPIESKWLSKGIREVRSVLGYSGDLLPSRRNHLIILLGFEDERAINLIREFEPARISLGIGDKAESGTAPHQAINVHKCARLKSLVETVNEFTFKAYDADATRTALQAQVSNTDELNTIIAPMNTKISTVGAAIFAMRDDAVQLCYAQPNLYNYDRYSIPDDDFYLFSIDGYPR